LLFKRFSVCRSKIMFVRMMSFRILSVCSSVRMMSFRMLSVCSSVWMISFRILSVCSSVRMTSFILLKLSRLLNSKHVYVQWTSKCICPFCSNSFKLLLSILVSSCLIYIVLLLYTLQKLKNAFVIWMWTKNKNIE
jgi:hypothetical protein